MDFLEYVDFCSEHRWYSPRNGAVFHRWLLGYAVWEQNYECFLVAKKGKRAGKKTSTESGRLHQARQSHHVAVGISSSKQDAKVHESVQEMTEILTMSQNIFLDLTNGKLAIDLKICLHPAKNMI